MGLVIGDNVPQTTFLQEYYTRNSLMAIHLKLDFLPKIAFINFTNDKLLAIMSSD